MSHVTAVCSAVIDNPHADGLIVDGGWGWMMQFPVNDKQDSDDDGDLFAQHPEDEWDTSSGGNYNVEVIPKLHCLAPRGVVDPQDMTLYDGDTGDWEKTNSQGLPNVRQWWRVTRPAGFTADFLYWYGAGAYDTTTAYYGELTGRAGWGFHYPEPNFMLHAFRYAPGRTTPSGAYNYLEVQWGADGFGQWSLVLPGVSYLKSYKCPSLGWREYAADSWTRVHEFQKGLPESKVGSVKPYLQRVSVETVDGNLCLNVDGSRLVYPIPQKQRVLQDPVVQAGNFRVFAYGARCAFNLSPLSYPTSCYAERRYQEWVDTNLFNTGAITCYDVSWEPNPPDVVTTCTVNENLEATEILGTGTDAITVNKYRPRVTFESSTERYRAVCYIAQVDIEPRVSAGTSSTYTTSGNAVLVEARGDLNSDWRNARCTLDFEVDRSAADALVANWKGNNKVTVTAGWDDGATSDTATHFTGYLTGRAMVRRGSDPERVSIRLPLRDGFHRLERKRWVRLGNFMGWQIHAAFRRALNHWGIPDSLIMIWDISSEAYVHYADFTGATPEIPFGVLKGKPRFDFASTAKAIDCLNELVEGAGWTWGYGRNGHWFVGPPPTYGGDPDFLLDDDTVSEGDMPYEVEVNITFDATPSGRPFANNVWVESTRGDQPEVAWVGDGASSTNSSADNFVGDDWWEAVDLPDGGDPTLLATRILNERSGRQKVLTFRPRGQVSLWPDNFVEWQGTGIGATTGSVFRVTHKGWEARNEGVYRTEFEGVLNA